MKNLMAKTFVTLGLLTLLTLAPALSSAADGLQFKPVKLGIVPDFSQSMPDKDQPRFSLEQLRLAIEAVKWRGGDLGLGLITEKSKKPLARLSIEQVVGRLDQRAFLNRLNKSSEAKFLADAQPRIERKADAKDTDVYGALERFNLFFGEPTQQPVDKALVIFSDGVDSKKKAKPVLTTDVRVFAIGMDRRVAEGWFGKNVVVVENFTVAVNQLRNN